MAVGRIIEGLDCIAEGAAVLCKAHPEFQQAMTAIAGQIPLRRQDGGFGRLLKAILGQQVSVASANALWAKLEQADLITANAILQVDEETLRANGLSRQKAKYAQALAAADMDYDALKTLPDAEVIKTLTQVKGIGTWTAEVYAMFSLGRADVFAHGDLALQVAAQVLFDLPDRPNEKQMRVMAADWAPWRAVAARILWAYYAHIKSREGVL